MRIIIAKIRMDKTILFLVRDHWFIPYEIEHERLFDALVY